MCGLIQLCSTGVTFFQVSWKRKPRCSSKAQSTSDVATESAFTAFCAYALFFIHRDDKRRRNVQVFFPGCWIILPREVTWSVLHLSKLEWLEGALVIKRATNFAMSGLLIDAVRWDYIAKGRISLCTYSNRLPCWKLGASTIAAKLERIACNKRSKNNSDTC